MVAEVQKTTRYQSTCTSNKQNKHTQAKNRYEMSKSFKVMVKYNQFLYLEQMALISDNFS